MAGIGIAERAAGNAELLRRGYEAFARNDGAALTELFHERMVWHAQRLGQLGGDHVGRDAVFAFFARTMELTGGTFRVEPQEILANDDGAAAVVRSTAARLGRRLDSRQVHQFHVRDGRVVEVWQFVDDATVVDAFWS